MTRGVVVGKFYPPHKGHHYLINTAAKNVDRLTVIVCAKNGQSIPGEIRADWLRKVHPDVNVILADDNIPESQDAHSYSRAWAEYTIKLLGYVPEIAFTSEEYGERWAKYMGSKHRLVDLARETIPCSGTLVRSNPLKYLVYLESPVRAYYVKRICVLGAESTGSTTMAEALAHYYKTNWVPEYGREYYKGKMYRADAGNWKTAEFIEIANEQCRREDMFAETANKVLICDTDSFATSVWHERYMGFATSELKKIYKDRKYDLYLLTNADIPFIQDGTRDGENIRGWMHELFKKRLMENNKKFEILSGTHQERLTRAAKAIDLLIQN